MEQHRAGCAPNPSAATAPRSYRRMYGNGSSDQVESIPYRRSHSYDKQELALTHPQSNNSDMDDEGVEVVLDTVRNTPKVVDSSGRNQNVFRPPQHQRGPVPTRGPAPVLSSSSHGYGGHPGGNYPPTRHPPMQVPYNHSGSFDHGEYPPQQQHYSPHVHYPTPGTRGYMGEDVNVISPNHKPESSYRPPVTPRARGQAGYYQYPPTSPVSRATATGHSSPRRQYSMRRGEGPYSVAQREGRPPPTHPSDDTFNRFPGGSGSRDGRPPLVTESSFDSDHYAHPHSPYMSHPPTPADVHPEHETHQQAFYGEGSFGSFDSANAGTGAPPQFDDYRYYGYPPESPYSHYSPNAPYYGGAGDHHPQYHHQYERSHFENEEDRILNEYNHHEDPSIVSPHDPRKRENASPATQETVVTSNKTCANGILLPKAAAEIDFEVTAPPAKPICPPSDHPIYDSHANINSHDVLCGRGGGTNSQVGNRRFRKLVQEFQPTYLMARRKEKPLLARTIVLIIRKRGGHFLKKDEESGELFEVGDLKAEAKTSQALREGLDVRATKSASTGKKGKKKKDGTPDTSLADEDDGLKDEDEDDEDDDDDDEDDKPTKEEVKAPVLSRAKTPPPRPEEPRIKTPPASPILTLPKLANEDSKNFGMVHPHSPEIYAFRKRRRMRSREGCFPMEDKLFPEFCPPRADLGRTTSPIPDHMDLGTPMRNMNGLAFESVPPEDIPHPGCAGIALSIMTGAATGSFCLGPSKWSRK
jgi:hypothetical protein